VAGGGGCVEHCILGGRGRKNVPALKVPRQCPLGVLVDVRLRVSESLYFIFKNNCSALGAGIAQLTQRLATGWTAEGSEFESR
jgi:hypothetical protein